MKIFQYKVIVNDFDEEERMNVVHTYEGIVFAEDYTNAVSHLIDLYNEDDIDNISLNFVDDGHVWETSAK